MTTQTTTTTTTNSQGQGQGQREATQDYNYAGKITALSSISHGEDKMGTVTTFRREKVVSKDSGKIKMVPTISGNSMRGILRDCGMKFMLDQLGISPWLQLNAYYFLFSGGTLSKQAGRGLDIDQSRKLRELIPFVGIMAGAAGNQIMRSKFRCGKVDLICLENAPYLPPEALEGVELQPSPVFLQIEYYSRTDDEKNDLLRGYLAPKELKLLDVKAEKKKTEREAGDDIDHEMGEHQQMRYGVETVCKGAEFWWSIGLTDVTRLEYESFLSCLLQFQKKPVIGGLGNKGHGLVEMHFDKWVNLTPRATIKGAALDLELGKTYTNYLKEKGDEILSALEELK